MAPDTETDEKKTDGAETESLLLYHIIGWGIGGILAISVIYTVLVTPPPGSSAYDWVEPLGPRGRIRVWSFMFERRLRWTVIGILLVCFAGAAVMKLGIKIKNYVGSR